MTPSISENYEETFHVWNFHTIISACRNIIIVIIVIIVVIRIEGYVWQCSIFNTHTWLATRLFTYSLWLIWDTSTPSVCVPVFTMCVGDSCDFHHRTGNLQWTQQHHSIIDYQQHRCKSLPLYAPTQNFHLQWFAWLPLKLHVPHVGRMFIPSQHYERGDDIIRVPFRYFLQVQSPTRRSLSRADNFGTTKKSYKARRGTDGNVGVQIPKWFQHEATNHYLEYDGAFSVAKSYSFSSFMINCAKGDLR